MATQERARVIQLDLLRNEEVERERIAKEEFEKMVSRSLRGLYARYNELEACFLQERDKNEKIREDIGLIKQHLLEKAPVT